MKKWIIAAAIVLTSVSVANAERLRCEIVQVLPGFFLPRCESYNRHEYRGHYRDNHDRWEYGRSGRHTRYERNSYYRERHPHVDRDIYDRPHRRDNYRW